MYRHQYRGKRRIGCLIPTLVIMCILALVVWLFLSSNLSYSAEGTILNLPFSGRQITIWENSDEPTLADSEPIEPNIIIEEPEPAPEPVPEPIPEYRARIEKSVFVPFDTLMDAASFDKTLASLSSETNTLIFEVKPDTGRLAFVSASELAQTARASAEDNSLIESALAKAKLHELNAVAYVSCFRDNLAPRKTQKYAARTKNRVIWLDYDNITWLNPYKPEARAYITDIIGELKTLGFAEIRLANLAFVYRGKTSILFYDEQEQTPKTQVISDFAKQLSEIEDVDISLYINIMPNEEQATPGGVVLADMASCFYRIATRLEPLEDKKAPNAQVFDTMLSALGAENFAMRFVPCIFTGSLDASGKAEFIALCDSKSTGYTVK